MQHPAISNKNASDEITRAKMLTTSLFVVLTVSSVHTQLNGEFWWLDKKLDNFRNVQPTEPEIEILGDYDTDESAKIVFRDDLHTNKLTTDRREKQRLYDHTNNKIVWPNENDSNNGYNKLKENMVVIKPKDQKNNIEDEFAFNFPKSEKYVIKVAKNSTETVPKATTKKTENELSGEILFNDDRLSSGVYKDKETQNICSYIKKKECYQNEGVIYSEW